jgi:flagellar hook-associated protein 3 FlgL
MMLPLKGSTMAYLADLNLTQNTMQKAQAQVSSGLRVQQPSDDPAAIGGILQLQADIARNQQTQSNLGAAASEASTADSSLQSAIQAVESAITLGAQGANTSASATERSNLADQLSGLQQTVVSISQTTVNGRYIFSGDQDSKPAYQLDLTQPTGVQQLLSAPATRQIVDPNGVSISIAKTAQEIFDARNPDSTPAAGNVFAAINALRTALVNNDQAGITQATTSLHAADDYLNRQLSFYGEVENRVADATSLAQKFQIQQKADLSQLRDADIPTAAVQLNQSQVQLQATLSVEATVSQAKNLFNFLA